MNNFYIIAMRLSTRHHNAMELQKTLTEYGCNIKTRLGLHDTSEAYCSNDGIIILQVCGDDDSVDDMLIKLNELDGIQAKLINLN